jgi:N-acetylmuramoyl-L-alanine amidase
MGPGTVRLITSGTRFASLFKRVASANHLHVDLFLSIHHDSVPDNLKERWEYEGKRNYYSDRFGCKRRKFAGKIVAQIGDWRRDEQPKHNYESSDTSNRMARRDRTRSNGAATNGSPIRFCPQCAAILVFMQKLSLAFQGRGRAATKLFIRK